MRFVRAYVLAFLSLVLALSLSAQQTTSSTQGSLLLQKSLTALTGAVSISDVTLSGTARRIAGSDDESGTVVVKVLAGTGSRLDLALPSGLRSEIRNTSSAAIAGSWSGPDGISHAVMHHNLLADPAWSPAFALASLLSAPNAVITYVGPETHNGQSVIHITASQQFPTASGNTALLLERLTQTEIYLDPNTNLPVALAFNVHPDNNALLDIPVELRFSGYQLVSGAQLPFRVQKFLNNSLFLDLQFQSATLNSGLSAANFQAQ